MKRLLLIFISLLAVGCVTSKPVSTTYNGEITPILIPVSPQNNTLDIPPIKTGDIIRTNGVVFIVQGYGHYRNKRVILMTTDCPVPEDSNADEKLRTDMAKKYEEGVADAAVDAVMAIEKSKRNRGLAPRVKGYVLIDPDTFRSIKSEAIIEDNGKVENAFNFEIF
ncbi:MAG: hypothetical protein KKE44_12465 [Proteobacteria bacterium]|nr:hypothetical protein [Pseudomonadota bacterium]MBU1583540.1 hypothetical protein [Pseudomonadota bacterium]MBU2455059.1 hypothetical protein [Pseudomonadota bacterium]MBU2627863.1 hypothetical protein [Pseudomonadota bacterium]